MNTDLTMKKADLEEQRANRASANADKATNAKNQDENKLFSFAQQIKDDFTAGKYSYGNPQNAWGKAWQELSALRDRIAPSVPDADLDAFLGGAAVKGPSGQWTGTGNASADTLQSLGAVASTKLPKPPAPASPIQGIMDFFTKAAGGDSAQGVHLYDPKTNQTFNYPSTSDNDYQDDLKKGFVPQ